MPDNEVPPHSASQRPRATVVIGDYELGAQIGRGSFATVYKGVNTTTNALVAVKSVVRSSLTRRLLENLETEINILRTVRHRSIVELIDCLKSRNHIHLVMEYCSLGDLSDYMRRCRELPELRNSYGGLNMGIARSFVHQLGVAMRFLRSRDIIHRDIKTQNILLQPPGNDYVMGESEARGVYPLIKVADFGFARNLPSTALAETLCGSPLYMAPEILHYEPYDAKADLWSIGAVVYEIMAGRPPFRANNHVELARIIERTNDNITFPDEKRAAEGDGAKWPLLDPVLKDLVRRLLKMNPNDRMPFEDFFAHPGLEDRRADDALPPQPLPLESHATGRSPVLSNEAAREMHTGRSPAPAASPRADAAYNHHRQYVQQAYLTRGHPPPSTRNPAAARPADERRDQNETGDEHALALGGEERIAAEMDSLSLGDDAREWHLRQQAHPAQRHIAYPPAHPPLPAAPQGHGMPANARHQRRGSLTEEEQAMAEREYVVIEKRAVEMNVLADEFESSPRTPLAFYPPRAGAIHQAPGVARQMTALARAVHDAVSPQYNISAEAADGPLNVPGAPAAGPDTGDRPRVASAGRTVHGVFNPLDVALAETFESRYSQGTPQEDPTIRRMEGLAYKAFAMSYLADIKWRMLPSSPATQDPLADLASGFLRPDDVTIEAAFVLYLRALSLLHRAMIDASRYWAGLHATSVTGSGGGAPASQTATRAGMGLRPSSHKGAASSHASAAASVTVSAAFNSAVQWVRTKFNECLERAEVLKHLAHGSELDNVSQVSVVLILYEKALDLGKAAALRELKWIDPLECDRAYQLAIWMLSAILETASTPSSASSSRSRDGQQQRPAEPLREEQETIDPEDRTIVERFIASIVKRREALQRRLMQHDPDF
ncbi:Serine/threonine-protein kinase [Coemansia biformis]|uniref:non-specific serine/threonine protein kinase n=1 Tax=Coemansia biformis TaxID=1286918 RepID=A0A9W8CXU4_9FUNG|nr:Serine/threonine-protein kinase [Coemansia biformis]